jgi:hypothetical protein
MTALPAASPFTAAHENELKRAAAALENPNFAARLADYAGKPLNRVLDAMPGAANRRLNAIVEKAILRCLTVAVDSLEAEPARPAQWMASAIAGVSGAVGGAFGLAALPVELPFTTTLMLRAIADIARFEGEDLAQMQTRLACLEVFALGARRAKNRTDIGYYAARTMLTRLTDEACSLLIERGIAGAAAPAVNGLVVEVSSRFGLVVSDKIVASALPVLGALGGATVNVLFTDHFQKIATAHFTIRRLERIYGMPAVHDRYAILTAQAPAVGR